MDKKRFVLCGAYLLLASVLLCGCATGAKGPDDRTLIMNTMNGWKAGLIEKNIESVMAAYSESFRDQEGRGKAEVRDFIQGAINEGYLDGITIDLDVAQVTINDVEATVSPIPVTGGQGGVSLSMLLKKENGAWLIVGTNEV
ncbi:MAG: hypothetical protein IT365_16940 [Candidatus Hydrogenedentes bacterium]|nr:hypothetical protein [Candidatus Hydrogenedentota bacterium]